MRFVRNCTGSASTINFDALIKRSRSEPRADASLNAPAERSAESGNMCATVTRVVVGGRGGVYTYMHVHVQASAARRYRVSKFNSPVSSRTQE